MMIRARAGFVTHAHSARETLLLHRHGSQPCLPLSLPRLTQKSSLRAFPSSRALRGFLCFHASYSASDSCHRCLNTGSTQIGIFSIWRFDSNHAVLDYALCRTTRALHTSTGKKLTTSELIQRLQLAKEGSVSQTSVPKAAPATGDRSVTEGKVHESATHTVNINPTPDNLEKESNSDAHAFKKSLSKLIPQHVVDMGFAKKERFSMKQDRGRVAREVLEGNQQRNPNHKHQIPVLHSDCLRNDEADVCSEPRASVVAKPGHEKKLLYQLSSPQVPSSRAKKANVSASANRKGLLAAAFDPEPLSIRVGGFVEAAVYEAQNEQGADAASKRCSVMRGASRKAAQDWCKIEEACQPVAKPILQDKMQAGRQFRPTETIERPAGSLQLEQQDYTERYSNRVQPTSSPSVQSQQQIESALPESFAKQVLVHENFKESTLKQHANNLEEATVQESKSNRLSSTLDMQTRKLPSSVIDCHTNNEHTKHERVSTIEHMEEERSSLQPQSERKRMYLEEQNSLNPSQEQHQLFGEHTKKIGSHVPHGTEVANGKFSLHQRSRDSTEENGEPDDMQHLSIKRSARMSSQKQLMGMRVFKHQDSASGLVSVNDGFGQWASGELLPEESQRAAASKPIDRKRPRKKKKNDLREKDLSVQPIRGEQHYEYLIRRKQVRAEAQKALVEDVDDYKHVGDDWIKKRLGWLCKEIPVLKASGTVKMLNNQRKWIKQEHLKELIEHLVRYMELKRAHRVLKWMQQQPFYNFEYDLHNNLAFILGRNDKLSRCQDVFDEIVRNGQFPDPSVFTALIKAYLNKGDQGDINDAWKLYNQMLQLGMTISETLSETLLKSLTCPTGRWIRQAEELFVKMKSSGLYVNEEMYSKVAFLCGKRGDHKKIDAMLDELRNNHLQPTLDILNAKLEACVHNGDIVRAEWTLGKIVEMGFMPNWRSYANLIQVYGKSNLPMQSWEVFEKMKGINMPINFVSYYSVIEAMASDGKNEKIVMQVLTEVEENGIKPLQPCYNSVMNMYLRLKNYEEVEFIFNRGKAAKVRPGHAAYNMLMKAYTESGQLDKAEALLQEMKKTEGMGPNTHTYNILLEGYGIACFKARARELFEEMSAKGCQLDHAVREKVESLISVKKIAELEKKRLTLTHEQREIIPGLLLGGAKMISPDRNRTYELHLEFDCENEVKRAIKDRLSFLFQAWWKPNQPGESPVLGKCEVSSEEGSPMNSFVRLETVSHGSLRFYAHQYRPDGEPIIPRLIHRWLKPRTLAYWYMYGGRKCQRTGGIILNASKYSGKQIQLVAKALKARTMDCQRRKRRNGDVIRFEGRSARWLWNLMEPYILKSFKEQLKPEEMPTDLAMAEGDRTLDSQDQGGLKAEELSSDEDDWEELEAEVTELLED